MNKDLKKKFEDIKISSVNEWEDEGVYSIIFTFNGVEVRAAIIETKEKIWDFMNMTDEGEEHFPLIDNYRESKKYILKAVEEQMPEKAPLVSRLV